MENRENSVSPKLVKCRVKKSLRLLCRRAKIRLRGPEAETRKSGEPTRPETQHRCPRRSPSIEVKKIGVLAGTKKCARQVKLNWSMAVIFNNDLVGRHVCRDRNVHHDFPACICVGRAGRVDQQGIAVVPEKVQQGR